MLFNCLNFSISSIPHITFQFSKREVKNNNEKEYWEFPILSIHVNGMLRSHIRLKRNARLSQVKCMFSQKKVEMLESQHLENLHEVM